MLYHDLFTERHRLPHWALTCGAVPQELLPYVPFFGRALLEMGTATEDYVQVLAAYRAQDRRRLAFDPPVGPCAGRTPRGPGFLSSGKATVAQTPELLDILRDMLLTVKLDNRERFQQIVLKTKARRESSLVPSGHAYVRDRLRAGFTTTAGPTSRWTASRACSLCAGWRNR